MRTYTFAIQKGGTGKTSVSINVAAELARYGRVLFIDADPQGNASSAMTTNLNYELADVLLRRCRIQDAVLRTSIAGLDLIPTAGLDGELRLYAYDVAKNKNRLFDNMAGIGELSYDYCVIDTSPALSPLECECILTADEVIPVLQIDTFSVDGLQIFVKNVQAIKRACGASAPTMQRVVLNAYDARLSQQAQIIESFMRQAETLAPFVVPVDQAFKKSQQSVLFIKELAGTKKETLAALQKIAEAIR